MKYYLEIYEPESTADVIASFESNTPFMSINTGDVINTTTMATEEKPRLIKVSGIQHILWDENDPKHKICVFTE
jgi:hypothetical protein